MTKQANQVAEMTREAIDLAKLIEQLGEFESDGSAKQDEQLTDRDIEIAGHGRRLASLVLALNEET